MKHTSRSYRDDRGATMVIFALVLTSLLIVAAMVVDFGAGYSERRQDQNAVDSGVLAGAIEIGLMAPTAQNITNEVMYHVEQTIGSISDTQWINDCPADEPPAGFTMISAKVVGLGGATPATRCISISGDELRVRVPTQTVETSFANVIGIDELSISAEANADVAFPGFSTPPPFVLPAGTGIGEVCLRTTGPSEKWAAANIGDLGYDGNGDGLLDQDPCSNEAVDAGTGQFGTVQPWSYKWAPCTAGNDITTLAIAVGLDHVPSRFPQNDPYKPDTHYPGLHPAERQEAAGCNATATPLFPNTFQVDTGISNFMLTCGIVGNGNSDTSGQSCGLTGPTLDSTVYPARLKSGEHVNSSYQFDGYGIDDAKLWEFFSNSDDAPAECNNSTGYGSGTTFAARMERLLTCLDDWHPSDGPIFTDDIITTPRFMFVPRIAETSVEAAQPCVQKTGGTCVHFNTFLPTFLSRIYIDAPGNKPAGDCKTKATGGKDKSNYRIYRWDVHEFEKMTCGGQTGTGDDTDPSHAGNREVVERTSGIVFTCGMLPQSVCDSRPPESDPSGTPVFDIFLSR